MTALGRKQPFRWGDFRTFERPVLVRADIRPGRVSAMRPKAVIELELAPMTATTDSKRSVGPYFVILND